MRWMAIDGAVPGPVCASLVDSYRTNIDKFGRKHKADFWSYRFINSHDLPTESEARTALDDIGEAVLDSIAREWGEGASIQLSQLVSWPVGTSQGTHVDTYFPDTKFAAILYLNDDYAGGATFLELPGETRRIQPVAGRLLVFEGSLISHGVDEILQGTRYTNAMWLSK